MHYDLIIGMGFRAYGSETAVEMGRKTLIIGKGTGSLCLFSNTIDVLGNLSEGMKMPDGLRRWIKDHPEHPYSKLDWERIEQALSSFRSVFRSQYTFQLIDHENCLIPTGAGTYRPTYLIPSTMIARTPLKNGKMLIVGFKGFKDFYADYMADQLNCRGIVIPLSEFPGQEMSATAIARLTERGPFREMLGRDVKKQMEGESLIGFPALLGIRILWE
jgi:glycerol-3-phosphate dehydrogenase subunit B